MDKLPCQPPSRNISMSISDEINRFESVHPSIYAIYEMIEGLSDLKLAGEIREQVVCIEDSFVNSQEWTLSRSCPTIHLGLLGDSGSPKSTLVHRYLTGQYLVDHSTEGGRFKKQINIKNQPYLLLIRDEGNAPDLQFASWLDVLIFVAGSHSDVETTFTYASRLNSYRLLPSFPIVLISTPTTPPASLALFKKIPHLLHFTVSPETGHNVDRSFLETCCLATAQTPGNRKNRKSNVFQKLEMETMETGVGRLIPVKQGHLMKKSFKLKKWKKKYIVLTTDCFCYYDNINCYMECKNDKIIELKHVNVKISEKGFVLTTVAKVFEFEVCAGGGGREEERDEWVRAVERGIFSSLSGCGIRSQESCADCGGGGADWGVINFGVVVCIGCSGVHRNLGCHISRVRSLVLDKVGPHILAIPTLLTSNSHANTLIYESSLATKPITPASSSEEKSNFIRRKYANLEFVPFPSVSKEKFLVAIRNEEFGDFMILLLRVDKYLLYLWAEELLGEIVARIRGGGVVVGAWVQVVLWNCEEMEPEKKDKLKQVLLEELLGEELRGVVEGW